MTMAAHFEPASNTPSKVRLVPFSERKAHAATDHEWYQARVEELGGDFEDALRVVTDLDGSDWAWQVVLGRLEQGLDAFGNPSIEKTAAKLLEIVQFDSMTRTRAAQLANTTGISKSRARRQVRSWWREGLDLEGDDFEVTHGPIAP